MPESPLPTALCRPLPHHRDHAQTASCVEQLMDGDCILIRGRPCRITATVPPSSSKQVCIAAVDIQSREPIEAHLRSGVGVYTHSCHHPHGDGDSAAVTGLDGRKVNPADDDAVVSLCYRVLAQALVPGDRIVVTIGGKGEGIKGGRRSVGCTNAAFEGGSADGRGDCIEVHRVLKVDLTPAGKYGIPKAYLLLARELSFSLSFPHLISSSFSSFSSSSLVPPTLPTTTISAGNATPPQRGDMEWWVYQSAPMWIPVTSSQVYALVDISGQKNVENTEKKEGGGSVIRLTLMDLETCEVREDLSLPAAKPENLPSCLTTRIVSQFAAGVPLEVTVLCILGTEIVVGATVAKE